MRCAARSIYDVAARRLEACRGRDDAALTDLYRSATSRSRAYVYTRVNANARVDAAQFDPRPNVKAALKPPATGNVPYQWVIRRLEIGRFLDSDQVFVPPGGSLKLVELAPNVSRSSAARTTA